ncbi:flippase-like domain-containing protein [Streptomyces sp. RB6PN25]|uniref:Flippase-like domain-containing protein n=1 Tax=Streptomyces humicola TaxID=2953240 RepID=A0ABT1PSJ9_9ACTN|nr:lysylphosphatidylglycerol synthase transmembrane domain-containing protein [Streptomyces humicola]MCQ4080652.1 flippase-like domain-containing protein [Streptomyces humicola]
MPGQQNGDDSDERPLPRFSRPGRAWWLGALVVIVAAVVTALTRRAEFVNASRLIARVDVARLAVAIGFEAASLVGLAAMERWLLRAGQAAARLRLMVALTVAANAVAGVLPGGAAFSSAWYYRQLRRRGVAQVLAAAVLVVAGALSVISLFTLLLAGAVAAGSSGPGASLRPVMLALAGLLLVGTALMAGSSRFRPARRAAWRLWRRIGVRSRHAWSVEDALARLVRQARSVEPGVRPWLQPYGLALLNWLCDAACLAACLWALGIGVPWRGLLVAYALTQVGGSLRLTPGSLGIVEASLTALLVLYGLRGEQAIAATLLYRILSYWALQPIGWACWFGLTLRGARPWMGNTP